MSRVTVCFGQFFSRHLLKHIKLRENDLYDTSLCYVVYLMMNLLSYWLSTSSSTMISSCVHKFPVAVLRLLQFLKIYILQNIVAMRFGCGGVFNDI